MDAWGDPQTVAKILESYRSWAVVGCSDNPLRPSYGVATYLQEEGYEVICVNPNHDSCIEGAPCVGDLRSSPAEVEVVDIFRRSDAVRAHVEEAIDIGAKAVWMQIGVIDADSARLAEEAGLDVVMDRCPKIELPRLRAAGRGRTPGDPPSPR